MISALKSRGTCYSIDRAVCSYFTETGTGQALKLLGLYQSPKALKTLYAKDKTVADTWTPLKGGPLQQAQEHVARAVKSLQAACDKGFTQHFLGHSIPLVEAAAQVTWSAALLLDKCLTSPQEEDFSLSLMKLNSQCHIIMTSLGKVANCGDVLLSNASYRRHCKRTRIESCPHASLHRTIPEMVPTMLRLLFTVSCRRTLTSLSLQRQPSFAVKLTNSSIQLTRDDLRRYCHFNIVP